jgi:hypothetical protein
VGRLFMKYQLEDIAEIALELADLGMGIEKNLILITLPGNLPDKRRVLILTLTI